MKPRDHTTPECDEALEQARSDARDGLPQERLDVVEQRLIGALRQQRAARDDSAPHVGLRWLVAAGALGAAAVAVVLVVAKPQQRTLVPSTVVAVAPARIVLQTGAVTMQPASPAVDGLAATELAPRTRITLAAGARLEVALSATARMAAVGPAQLALLPSGLPEITSGHAALTVAPLAVTTPFIVRVGDAEVVVHGTRFVVGAEGGRFRQVEVFEGEVELREAGGAVSRTLRAGESVGERDSESAMLAMRTLDDPWWIASDGRAPSGYLSVGSKPPGAEVEVDDAFLGLSPVMVAVSVGAHAVRVAKVGYEDWTGTGVVAEHATRRLHAALELLPSPATRPVAAKIDPWRTAQNLLDQRRCGPLARQARELERMSTQDADRARAALMSAECYLRTGEKAQALRVYQRVLRVFPQSTAAQTALFESVKLMTELGRREAALGAVDSYLGRYPHGEFVDAATFRRCELLLALDRLTDARQCLERYGTVFPQGRRVADALLLRATEARVSERWAEAADLYGAYLARAPYAQRSEEALYQRVVCMQRGKLPGLADAARTYLATYPRGRYIEWVMKVVP